MTKTNKRGALRRRNAAASALLASTILTGAQAAFAQQVADSGNAVPEIVVTAQKRSEDLQKVPVSIEALSQTKIEQLNINNFSDYAKFLPSVSFTTVQAGQTDIYIRGIASGGVSNHSGPLPTVGLYLDEIPVTTIQGQLDVHIYDVSRIEELSGPQGTLYGASSEAGTVRIISNQPDLKSFSASYDLEVNSLKNGELGNVAEGYVNVPLSNKAAIRIVGWQEHDGGYIDNIPGTRTYPSAALVAGNLAPGYTGTLNNSGIASKGYNTADTYGGRAALRVELNDDWTVTPMIMGQDVKSNGVPQFDSTIGDLQVTHFYPETNHDQFVLFGLTVQGKIGDFDLTYAGGGLIRDITSQSDYTDYTFFYDQAFNSGVNFFNNAGQNINPSQVIKGKDHFTKQSHELRISSPSTDRFRVTAGLFLQRQEHYIEQDYVVNGLSTAQSVTNWPNTFWLTEQLRTDRDYAAFYNMSYDITPDLTANGGVRVFKSDNSLYGFYGFSNTTDAFFGSHSGEAGCFILQSFNGAPCVDLNKEVKEINVTYNANLTYKLDADRLIYATASSGFRPGGVNRNGNLPPYTSDMIYNYEFGWKTSWLDKSLRWNGALYWMNWDNVQFAYLGANSLTVIENAGEAVSRGLETDLTWRATHNLSLSSALALTDAELSQSVCASSLTSCSVSVESGAPGNTIVAPSGRQLPQSPYIRGNVTARYDWNITEDTAAFVQSSLVFTGSAYSDLRTGDRQLLGREPSYTTVDLSAGTTFDDKSLKLFVKNLFDERGQAWRSAECTTSVCGHETYILPVHPFTVGIRFGQVF